MLYFKINSKELEDGWEGELLWCIIIDDIDVLDDDEIGTVKLANVELQTDSRVRPDMISGSHVRIKVPFTIHDVDYAVSPDETHDDTYCKCGCGNSWGCFREEKEEYEAHKDKTKEDQVVEDETNEEF